jgi:hypothetical protein
MPEQMVVTPGGFRPSSRVHKIEADHHLDLSGGRIRKFHRSGRLVTDFGEFTTDRPARPPRPGNVANGEPTPAADAVPSLGSGWIAYAGWTNNTGTPVSLLKTAWTVPPAPTTQSGQTVFLFNGIENATMILQPVLQWGVSAAGGGSYWAIGSWYASGPAGHSFYSSLTQVAPGAQLVGTMTLTGESASGFSYDCQFDGIAASDLPIQNVPELTWCVQTLEAYQISARSDYPPAAMTAMTAIGLQVDGNPAPLNWTPYSPVTDTGQHCVIVSNDATSGEVDLYYQQPGPATV